MGSVLVVNVPSAEVEVSNVKVPFDNVEDVVVSSFPSYVPRSSVSDAEVSREVLLAGVVARPVAVFVVVNKLVEKEESVAVASRLPWARAVKKPWQKMSSHNLSILMI